jgi:hypothetical protein
MGLTIFEPPTSNSMRMWRERQQKNTDNNPNPKAALVVPHFHDLSEDDDPYGLNSIIGKTR